MAQKRNSIEMFKRRLIAEVSRDKKKAITLAVLLLVAAFAIGKLFVSSSPESASAETGPARNVHPEPHQETEDWNVHRREGKPGPRESGKGFGKGIRRDIFLPDSSKFPPAVKVDGSGNTVKIIPGPNSEQDIERERVIKLIREEGAKLQLESTIVRIGDESIAIIDGTVLGLGGVIKGFRIVEIHSQACVLEKEGVKLNLTMK